MTELEQLLIGIIVGAFCGVFGGLLSMYIMDLLGQ